MKCYVFKCLAIQFHEECYNYQCTKLELNKHSQAEADFDEKEYDQTCIPNVMILSFRTDGPGPIVYTKIKLLLEQ